MPAIGYVTKQSSGGYKGQLKTLTIRAEIDIVPNAAKSAEAQPDFVNEGDQALAITTGGKIIRMDVAGVSRIVMDKTGTLTTNRMTAVQAYLSMKYFHSIPRYDDLPENLADTLVRAISINSRVVTRFAARKD